MSIPRASIGLTVLALAAARRVDAGRHSWQALLESLQNETPVTPLLVERVTAETEVSADGLREMASAQERQIGQAAALPAEDAISAIGWSAERPHKMAFVQEHQQSSAQIAAGIGNSISTAWLACEEDDETGDAVGCRQGACQCHWGQQCYPKWVSSQRQDSSNSSRMMDFTEDVGVCETAMPVLALMSFMLFSLVLTAFVALRTFLQWSILEDGLDPKMLTKPPLGAPSQGFATFGQEPSAGIRTSGSENGPRLGDSAETDSEDSDSDDDKADKAERAASREQEPAVKGPGECLEGNTEEKHEGSTP